MSSSAFISAGFDSQGVSFAALFQGLDAHRLRVVSASQTSKSTVPQEFAFDKSTKISTLKWVNYSPSEKNQQMKRRKKIGDSLNEASGVIALGTTQGTVLIYSPVSNSIVANLRTGSSSSISAIAESGSRGRIFALQLDSTVTEFDLNRSSLVASLVIPISDPTALINHPELIIASTAPHLCKNNGIEIEITYASFATPVRQILALGKSHFAAIAEEDRQVLIFKYDSPKPVHSLICPSTNASHISCSVDLKALAVTTEDGEVLVFEDPTQPKIANAASTKLKRNKPVPQSSPKFSIQAALVKKNTPLPISHTLFVDNKILLAWPEQGSVPVIDSVSWRDEKGTVKTENIKLEKQPAAPLAREHLVGGVDPASVPLYEEQHANVVSGDHVADLSDHDSADINEEEDGETLADRLEALETEMDKREGVRSDSGKDAASDSDLDDMNDEENRDTVDRSSDFSVASVPNSSSEQDRQSRLRRKELKLKLSQPGSFATLLNQAITLSDKQLLEICLEEKDAQMIKTSIVKLQPSLAASLLEHLASTMARSQNRSTALTQWIRWVVIIHGAYLVSLPNLLKTLSGLHSTLSARATTLPRLLALQGRLDLLEEQFNIRNELAAAAADDDVDEPEAYYDEEEALIVNGEEANDSSSDSESSGDLEIDADDAAMEDDGTISLSQD